MLSRVDLEHQEDSELAPFAIRSSNSRGREYALAEDKYRTAFQRDRDRILHCAAFRKLEFKTQVYMVNIGDYFRTRLTHSMEVAQIARTIARTLRLNSDLVEAIALAHDIGHTPFGHSGEVAMKQLLKDEGGFEHNEQGLRVVEVLEERYTEHPGLNLTYEVREGIIKHDTDYDSPCVDSRFCPNESSSLESQIVDLADEMAYNSHDLDDAIKMGLLCISDLEKIDWIRDLSKSARLTCKESESKFITYRIIGGMMDMQIEDALKEFEANIARYKIETVADVRNCPHKIACASDEMKTLNKQLKDLLMDKVYCHPNVLRMNIKARMYIERLFKLYYDYPKQLPLKYQERINRDGIKRVITDYLSGMTDRYLLKDYRRAFEPDDPLN